eukprot:TRINITY_DN30338_c0_g1_i1.p1 TRINITY_DN30338_c0_g1~~TRINITY_DN30338_c0_g1_i1.p1  ORF type:complete len:444 (-),score=98.22 TRINITY_DN30338_c0_g1_i1:124-1413(-)
MAGATAVSPRRLQSRRTHRWPFLLLACVAASSNMHTLFIASAAGLKNATSNLSGLRLQERKLATLILRRGTATSASEEMATDGEGELPRRIALGAAGLLLLAAGSKRFLIDGPPEFDPLPETLTGRTVLITGGNTGLGKESALRLAKAGATVVLTARSDEKGEKAVDDIKKAVPGATGRIHYLHLDLADLADVKSFRGRLEAQPWGDHIDVLMNNAGVMAIPQRQETKDGFEQQFGVNHLGHFALVQQLLPLLKRANGFSRIINVSSTAHLGATKELMEGDLMAPERYTQWGAYCQSKLANVLFTKELDRRFKEAGVKVTAVSCHPGGVDTDLARWLVVSADDPAAARKAKEENEAFKAIGNFLTRTVQLGANTQVYLAAGADGGYDKSGGEYFDNMAPGLLNSVAKDEQLAKQLWNESERLTGVKLSV